jgi:hypothetical protein
MFTSGYADGTVNLLNDSNSINNATYPMLSRSFRITKFELNVEM